MTEGQIWFNYQQAIRQADELDRIASALDRGVCGELEEGLNALAAGWYGENAKRFQSKGHRLRERVSGTARSLRNAAEEVRAAARRAREIELANLAIVETDST